MSLRTHERLALSSLALTLVACHAAAPDVSVRVVHDQPQQVDVGEPSEPAWFHGSCFCSVCGEVEVRTWHGDEVVEREAVTRQRDDDPLRTFHEWYEREVGDEHEHDWRGFGCLSVGAKRGEYASVMCSRDLPSSYFTKVPALPVPLARRVLEQMGKSPGERRWAMLSAFDEVFAESPLSRALAGEDVPEDELRSFFERWVEASANEPFP